MAGLDRFSRTHRRSFPDSEICKNEIYLRSDCDQLKRFSPACGGNRSESESAEQSDGGPTGGLIIVDDQNIRRRLPQTRLYISRFPLAFTDNHFGARRAQLPVGFLQLAGSSFNARSSVSSIRLLSVMSRATP
jgi:hypothetical protein